MTELARGALRKMRTAHEDPVRYTLPVGGEALPVNELLGSRLKLEFRGAIHCIHCGRETKKSFAQGYCFPCFRSLAECDRCIVRPEECHFHQGTCRDESWATAHCFQPHYVYLANSSGLKVGITRGSQVPTRWMDQGAAQALPVFQVRNRYHSGLVEVAFKEHVGDRTDWRRMLKGEPDPEDLPARREELRARLEGALAALAPVDGACKPVFLKEEPVREFRYPVLEYPARVSSLNFDRTPRVEGTLLGIKGQYLILDTGVLNVRKFGGYEVAVAA